jgi:hypothetical protein
VEMPFVSFVEMSSSFVQWMVEIVRKRIRGRRVGLFLWIFGISFCIFLIDNIQGDNAFFYIFLRFLHLFIKIKLQIFYYIFNNCNSSNF